MKEDQIFFCPRDPHIKEPSFFLIRRNLLFVSTAVRCQDCLREEPISHIQKIDSVIFQALAGVYRG